MGMLGKYSSVVFDFDDTLLATFDCRKDALIRTAADFGKDLNAETIRANWGRPFYKLIESLVPGLGVNAFIKHYSEVLKQFDPKPTPGAAELLKSLAKQGKEMYIVSSSNKELLKQDLDVLDFTKYFTRIWSSEDTTHHKPDPKALEPITDYFAEREVDLSKVVFIGDSIRDYRAAAGNGLDFIGVLSGFDKRENFLKAGLPRKNIANSLSDLI